MFPYNFKTYAQLFTHISSNDPNQTFLNYIEKNSYQNISTSEFSNKVKYLSYALKEMGITKNEHIAIHINSSPSWLIIDFALQIIGAISVPIFKDISQKNLTYQIHDSNIQHIFTDDSTLLNNKNITLTIFTVNNKNANEINIEHLYKKGQYLDKKNIYNLEKLIKNVHEEDTFSVIYTSGSTGIPKGVELTHKNIISQLHSINANFDIDKKDRALSLLPLAHIFERVVMSFYLSKNTSIYFVDDLQNIANLMQEVRPTIMTVVPRLLEKIFIKIQTKVSQTKGISKIIAHLAFNRALTKQHNTFNLLDTIYDTLVYSKFRESFGGKLKILITGGSSLNKEIYTFFVNIKLPLYQGYGLTESSPVICVNTPKQNKIGTCGLPLNNVQVKLTKENELLARGPNIMKGYKNQQALTNRTIDKEGWLHTGDLAHIDEEGFITIKSRKKELFKTSTGKYVSAIAIEQELVKSKFIDFAMVIADNKQYVTALLFIDVTVYEQYKKSHTLTESFTLNDFCALQEIQNNIKEHINHLNSTLNKWEQIVKYEIITQTLDIQKGELTPSMKICRDIIEKKYEKKNKQYVLRNYYEK